MSNDLLNAILKKDVVATHDVFSTQITKHIQRVLDNKRKELGKTIFSEGTTTVKYSVHDGLKLEQELEKNLKDSGVDYYKTSAIFSHSPIKSDKNNPPLITGIHVELSPKFTSDSGRTVADLANEVCPKTCKVKVYKILNSFDVNFQ